MQRKLEKSCLKLILCKKSANVLFFIEITMFYAGSNPVSRSTRLSLDAIRVPGSAFYFAFSLAFMAGYLFCNATPRRSRRCIACGGFFSHRRARSSASPFPKKVTLRLCCFACKRARNAPACYQPFSGDDGMDPLPSEKKRPTSFLQLKRKLKAVF